MSTPTRWTVALAFVLAGASSATAQLEPRLHDRVRVTSEGGTITGRVLAVEPGRLVLRPDHDRPVAELQIESGALKRLEVGMPRRSRARGALIGMAAVAVIAVSAFFLDWATGGPSGWPRDRQGQINYTLLYGSPLVGAAAGYALPGHAWRPASLPRDSGGR